MTDAPHTDLHDKRVLVHLTDGTTTIDGTLLHDTVLPGSTITTNQQESTP